MKFGLFLGAEYPARRSMAARVNALVEQVRLARDLGFDCALAGQHYLSYPVQILQPTPLLGRLAAEAGDMRIGTGIVLLPLQHPVDMAEQVATLDQITGGRFIFGVGLGYEKEEFEAFGLEVSDRVGRFEESLGLMKQLWTEDEVHFEGKHFTLHTRPSSWPLQKPYPPVWIAANGHGPVRRAARLGDVWFANPHARFSTLAEQMDIYEAALAEYGTERPEDVVVSRELFVAESQAEAMRIARPALHERYRVYAVQGQDEQLPPGDRFESDFDALAADRFVLGDPQQCIEEIRRYEELGFNHFIIDYHWLDLDDATALNTLRLFGERVMPAFR